MVGSRGGGSGIKGTQCMGDNGLGGGGQRVVESRGRGWWGSRGW